jgi:hypothetical protein
MYITKLIDAGFNFEIEGENLAVQPASKLTTVQLQFIRQHKAEILDELRHGTDLGFKKKELDIHNSINPEAVKGEFNKTNPIHLEEAIHLYKSRGWIQIFSGYLNQSIYLMKNKWVKVPDATLLKYTRKEIEVLNGLSWEEIQTLHEAKVLFKGEIL